MKRTLTTLVLMALALALAGGCGIMNKLTGGGGHMSDHEDIKAAYERGDYEFLQSYCETKKNVNTSRACDYANRVKRDANDKVVTAKLEAGGVEEARDICKGKVEASEKLKRHACKVLAQRATEVVRLASCEDIVATWEANKRSFGKPELTYAVAEEAAVKMGQCGHWEYVFEKMAHYGSTNIPAGARALKRLEQEGFAVEKELLHYLARHKKAPFGFKNGIYASHNITRWLADGGHFKHCKRYVRHAENMSDAVVSEWLRYFVDGFCTEGAQVAARLLTSGNPKKREFGCFILGDIGGDKHVRKLQSLAKTDPAYRIEDLNKIYYVRDTCLAAAGKITSR